MSEGITYLASIPTLPKHLQAERIKHDNGRIVIDRNSTIAVEKESMTTEKPLQMAATGDVITAPPIEERPEVTYASRPGASDPLMVRPDVEVGEHGVGSPPMTRSVAEINANQPIVGAVAVKPQPVAAKPVMPPRPAPAPAAPAPVVPVVVVKPKMRVKLSNSGMGKVTVSVQNVAIGDGCVILAYPSDAENIVEPPLCNEDNPIRVDFNDKRYNCCFAGQTAELEGLYLVILIRIDDDK